MARAFLYLLVILLATACTSAGSPTPAATPLPRLVTTPALEPWVSQRVAAYTQVFGFPGFEVEVLPPASALEAAAQGLAELLVTAQDPPASWFTTPLGQEGIAVIVQQDNPNRSFTLQELSDLFTGRIVSWESLGGEAGWVQPIVPLEGDEARVAFEASVQLGVQTTSNALLGPSPGILASAVAQDPAAIGYLPCSQAMPGVAMARVEGILPIGQSIPSGQYPLVLQVLAMAPREPSWAVRSWLSWVQSSLAQ